MMRVQQLKNPRELCAGLLFAVIGVAAAIKSTDYDIGTATNMGPGYFPETLSLLLIALGLGSVVRGLLREATETSEDVRALMPLFLIILGVFGFAFTVDRYGLIPAIVVLVGCACFKHALVRPVEVLCVIGVLILFSVGLFVYGFAMPFNIF
jgi:hypothetical protein